MKRFHVHLHVTDLAQSVTFCIRLFATKPARTEADYAKWMLEDPPVNFAISTEPSAPTTGCCTPTAPVTAGACCAPASTAPSPATSCC